MHLYTRCCTRSDGADCCSVLQESDTRRQANKIKINSKQTSLFLNDNQTTCDCPETVPESDFIISINDGFFFLVVSQIAEQEKLFLETVTVELVLHFIKKIKKKPRQLFTATSQPLF